MTSYKLSYRTVDVFTNKRLETPKFCGIILKAIALIRLLFYRFKGNQLAVLDVGETVLSPPHMQMIAREFNFSETVFLRRNDSGEFVVNIYTPVVEIDFAGHPVIGTGHVIFQRLLPSLEEYQVSSEARLLTNSGPVTLHHNAEEATVSAQVPHNIHIHSRLTTKQQILDTQPSLQGDSSTLKEGYPAVSIVKRVTYTLVDLTKQPEVFMRLSAGPSQATDLDDDWSPSFTGVMYYLTTPPYIEDGFLMQRLRVRMIAINLEDPACGSGCSSLCAYLALQRGGPRAQFKFLIEQGKEIGRDSYIHVGVTLNQSGDGVETISLTGQAAMVTEGTLLLPE
ncbi:unnamed protein product [Clonostachys rosea]|uniref:Phenazine biosynthesis protein n=1 Tax=Bionectria ochroleuca TaxID=29856 RepID=A0ABY6UDW0_BIOOC|nr:unnamed protein product [Clonostachys rosea]